MKNPSENISRRHFLGSAGLFTAGMILLPEAVLAAESPVTTIIREARTSALTLTKLRKNISLIQGSGGNICVAAGQREKLLVDAGIDVSKTKMQQILASLGNQPVKHLINTHWHFDHVSGNQWLHEAGATITAHENTRKHLSRVLRVDDWDYTFPAAPPAARPSIVLAQERTMTLDGQAIVLRHYDQCHTDSDLSVHFTEADVLHLGDTWWNGHYPFVDFNTGGTMAGMVAAADASLVLATEKTILVPGHGPAGTKAQLREYRDMLAAMLHKVDTLKKQGKSLREVVAEKPSRSYDAKWGTFLMKADNFTGLVYRSV
jgi:glyoxylase-like metal-dependent hydrolase (beta-lactamase superfamily II)